MNVKGCVLAAMLLFAPGFAAIGGQAAVDPRSLEKADRYSREGFKALDAGDIEQAKKNFEKAVSAAPLFPDGHRGLGHLAMREKRYEDALREYEAARSGYVELGDLLYNVALKRYADEHRQLPSLEKELAQLQGGGASDSGLSGADRRFAIQDIQDRIRAINNTPAPSRDNMGAPPAALDFDVGTALSRLGRWNEAVEAFELCIKKNAELSAAYNNLALAYWRAGRLDDARKSLAKAEGLGFPVNPKFKADLERAQPQPPPEVKP